MPIINGELYTRRGEQVKLEDLTLQFSYSGRTCPIGKFEPEEYPDLPRNAVQKEIQLFGIEILMQLDESQIWSVDEMTTIAMMQPEDFIKCIEPVDPKRYSVTKGWITT